MITVDRVWVVFPVGEEFFVPGRHVTDHQLRLFMKFRKTNTTAVAAAKAVGRIEKLTPPIASPRNVTERDRADMGPFSIRRGGWR
ncbi:hypothetical protein EN766_04995 [Mesorhizobium sp. M2A.F.Ca.ET.046.02.1.1]|nr:hypothetical protein EN766_04995 [Mesorhizobium sp. M2A.F.Ca.ET.046.02.1.1]